MRDSKGRFMKGEPACNPNRFDNLRPGGSQNQRKRASESSKEFWSNLSPERRVYILKGLEKDTSEAQKGTKRPSLIGNKHNLGRVQSQETKQKVGAAAKARWSDAEYKSKVLQKILSPQLPNKPERRMMTILGDEFEYTGDGKRIIVGLNPDFVHKTQPLVVEVYGIYWHRNDDPNTRIKKFAEGGYACAVFWENEF